MSLRIVSLCVASHTVCELGAGYELRLDQSELQALKLVSLMVASLVSLHIVSGPKRESKTKKLIKHFT